MISPPGLGMAPFPAFDSSISNASTDIVSSSESENYAYHPAYELFHRGGGGGPGGRPVRSPLTKSASAVPSHRLGSARDLRTEAHARKALGPIESDQGVDDELEPPGPETPQDWVERMGMVRLIQSGNRTAVWEGIDRLLDVGVAIKVGAGAHVIDELQREAAILELLRHESVIRFIAWFVIDDSPRIVTELADTTLLDALKTDEYELNEHQLRSMMAQAADGLSHIHGMGYVHGDIKADNMLLIGDRLKIADFGLTALRGTQRSGIPRGTDPYMAPELIDVAIMIRDRKRTAADSLHTVEYAVDVWAFAIVIYSVLLCDLPWDFAAVEDDSYNCFVNDSSVRTREPWSVLAAPLLDLMLAMLSPDPDIRPEMADVAREIRGPWLLTSAEPEPEFEGTDWMPEVEEAEDEEEGRGEGGTRHAAMVEEMAMAPPFGHGRGAAAAAAAPTLPGPGHTHAGFPYDHPVTVGPYAYVRLRETAPAVWPQAVRDHPVGQSAGSAALYSVSTVRGLGQPPAGTPTAPYYDPAYFPPSRHQ